MDALFLKILCASAAGSCAIVVILLARLLLRRLPKVYSYGLWLAAAVLLCGFLSFTSPVGLGLTDAAGLTAQLPRVLTEIATAQVEAEQQADVPPDGPTSVFVAGSVTDGGGKALLPPITLPPGLARELAATPYASVDPIQIHLFVGSMLWLLVASALVLYGLVSAGSLWLKLRGAALQPDGSYQTQTVKIPFVMGLACPRVYLPTGLTEEQRSHILLHERAHIRRGDHLVKPLAYLLLCVHWFNPLCWLAFYCMSRDMEMSCDEAVIRQQGSDIKQDYTRSLLALSTGRVIWNGSPLAFGEGSAAGRIKNALGYKKPAFWVAVVVVVALVVLGVALVTSQPTGDYGMPDAQDTSLTAELYRNRTTTTRSGEAMRLALRVLPLSDIFGVDSWSIPVQANPEGDNRLWITLTIPNVPEMHTPAEGSRNQGFYERAAITTFALTKDLQTITYQWSPDGERRGTTTSYTRQWATDALGGDPWDRTATYADFLSLYDQLTADHVDGREVFVDQNTFAPTADAQKVFNFTLPEEIDWRDAQQVGEWALNHYTQNYMEVLSQHGYTILEMTFGEQPIVTPVAGDAAEFVFSATVDIETGDERLLPGLPMKEPRQEHKGRYFSRRNQWYMRVKYLGDRKYEIAGLAGYPIVDGLSETFDNTLAESVPANNTDFSFAAPNGYEYLTHIGLRGVEAWMNAKFDETLPDSERISSYVVNIGDLQLTAGDRREFLVRATLGYTTYNKDTNLITSNGKMILNDQNSWDVTDSQLEFRIRHIEEDDWQIVSVGTGGGGVGLLPCDPEKIPEGYNPDVQLLAATLRLEQIDVILAVARQMKDQYKAGIVPESPTFQPDSYAQPPADIDWGDNMGSVQIEPGNDMFPLYVVDDTPVNYTMLLGVAFFDNDMNPKITSVSFHPK